MITSQTISGIHINYVPYVWAYGKTPRGTGMWAYYFGDDEEPHFYNGSFTETKKQAVKDAKAAGYWSIKVGS